MSMIPFQVISQLDINVQKFMDIIDSGESNEVRLSVLKMASYFLFVGENSQ